MDEYNIIPSHQFTYDNYGVYLGYAGHIEYDHYQGKPADGFIEIGRCEASKLRIRPRLEGWAVMLYNQEKDETFWLHVLDFN